MTMLVSLIEAKDHLHIEQARTDIENDLTLKIEIASDILIDFLKLDADDLPDTWYDTASPPVLTPPSLIKGYTLVLTARLYEDREAADTVLSEGIKDGLRRYRDPALA